MSVGNWDEAELQKIALESGRPLEVRCAMPFIQDDWKVRLSVYYQDFVSEKPRELDFIAERSIDVPKWKVYFRVLASCKGFPTDHSPTIYTITPGSPSVEKANLMCYGWGAARAVADKFRSKAASWILMVPDASQTLHFAPQAVGFDVIVRTEKTEKIKKDGKQEEKVVVTYTGKGDGELYGGLDSAIKAAVFRFQGDRKQARSLPHEELNTILINIPLLISSREFISIPIDGGQAGKPKSIGFGHHVTLYPAWEDDKHLPPFQPMTSLFCDENSLPDLVSRLRQKLVEGMIHELRLMWNS